MKRVLYFLMAGLIVLFVACERETGKGVLKLSLTDSPVDTTGLKGVYITINEIQVNTTENGWETLDAFEGPKTVNLIELTRGTTEDLGDFVLDEGNYTQIRFILDAPSQGESPRSNPGCYLEYDNQTTIPLLVPSGSQSGFKATGEFVVPINDTIKLTADFDVRKSVVRAGNSGNFILKPTIRVVAQGEAGQIRGHVANIPDSTKIIIYAYADGKYTTTEASDPAEGAVRFPAAVNSDMVDSLGIYHIAYLAQGKYDLVVTSMVNDKFDKVIGIVEDVTVESRKTTDQDIDISTLH